MTQPQQRTAATPPEARDRAFWMTFRRALLMIVKGIEERYDLGER